MTRLSLDSASALGVMDVPLVILEGLAAQYGTSVWRLTSANARARLSGGAAGRQVIMTSHTTMLDRLMIALREDVPGLRSSVASFEGTPEWMVMWLVNEGLLDEGQMHSLLQRTWTSAMAAWLSSAEGMDGDDRTELENQVLSRSRGMGAEFQETIDTVRLMTGLANDEAAKDMRYEKGLSSATWTKIREEFEESAQRGREMLGDGESEESRARWWRFFDLIEAEVSRDRDTIIDAAARSLAAGLRRALMVLDVPEVVARYGLDAYGDLVRIGQAHVAGVAAARLLDGVGT